MSFYKKYELQRLAHEGEAKVFRATQNATGLQVFLHVFPVNTTTRDLALEVQRRLAGGPAADLLETGEFAGAIYVVTPPNDAMFDLRAYLHAHAPGAAQPPSSVAPPPPAPAWTAPPQPPAPAPVQYAPPPPPQFAPPPPPPPPPPMQFSPPPPAASPAQFAPPPPAPAQFAPPPPPSPAQFAPPPPPPVQFAPPPPAAHAPPPFPPQPAPFAPPSAPQAPPPFVPPAQPPRSSVQQHPTAHGQEAVTQPVEPRRRRRTTEIISHGTVTVGHGPAEPSTSGPGEFTRMFSDPPAASQPGAVLPSAPPQPAAAAPPAPQPFPPPPAAPPPAHAPASSGPGEFTRLFSGPPQTPSSSSYTGAPLPPPAPHTASPYQTPPPTQQPAPHDREMADFERIFGPAGGRPFPADEPPPKPPVSNSPLPSWPQTPPAPPPSQQGYQQPPMTQQGSGEFTRFFGNNFSGDPVDVEREQQRAAAEPSAPPRRPFQKASEFTQMFGPGAMDPGAPAPPPPPRTSNNWADQSGAYTMFDSRLNTPPPTTGRRQTEMTQHAGPSEYTRMIGGGGSGMGMPGAGLNQDSSALKSGAMPAANPKQVPGQQMSAPPSKAGQIGLFIAIGGILIALIVALVLLLTSK